MTTARDGQQKDYPQGLEMFGFAKNRFIGIGKVMVHAYACFIAYLIKYL